MDDIPPHILNQFRLFMQTQQSYEIPATATAAAPHGSGPAHPTNAAALTQTAQGSTLNSLTSSQPPSTSFSGRNPPITPYHSARQPSSTLSTQNRLLPSAPINTAIGSQALYGNGHGGLPANIPTPPQSMGSVTGLGTSFLGFQQRTGQANQARLSAAAHNLPRRPALQNRRHHLNSLSAPSSGQASSSLTQSRPNRRARGPSGPRPHAHRQHPELHDVIYSPSGQGEPTHAHIRVKVLPDCGVRFSKFYPN